MLSHEEIKGIAHEAARRAVTEVLLTLGVNASDSNAFIEMQKDFAYVRSFRESVETIRSRGLMAATGVIVTGICGAVWMTLSGKLH